jgi:hypothetical protein
MMVRPESPLLKALRATTVRISAPCPSQPVADETHCLRPLMIHFPLSRQAVVRAPSAGGAESKVALASGSLFQSAA